MALFYHIQKFKVGSFGVVFVFGLQQMLEGKDDVRVVNLANLLERASALGFVLVVEFASPGSQTRLPMIKCPMLASDDPSMNAMHTRSFAVASRSSAPSSPDREAAAWQSSSSWLPGHLPIPGSCAHTARPADTATIAQMIAARVARPVAVLA